MPDLAFPIETERLLLRPFTTSKADIDDAFAYHRLEEVARYQFWAERSHDQVAEKIAEWARDSWSGPEPLGLPLAFELKATGHVVGDGGLWIKDREARQAEIGYSFHPDCQRQGLGTEAVTEVLRLAFETFGMHRVYARCDVLNTGSWKLMEKLGLRREAHFREHAIFKGRWDGEFYYAILEDEWRARAAV